MINEYPSVPEHLQERWQQVSDEIAISSKEVNEASKRYNEAILARIALNQVLRDWQQSQ